MTDYGAPYKFDNRDFGIAFGLCLVLLAILFGIFA